MEYTVYTTREQPVTIDELRDRIKRFGLPVTVLSDGDASAATGRWFISLEPEGEREDDTMLDATMVVIDVNSDASLVKGSAMSLLMGFEEADDDDDVRQIRAMLKKPQQSFYCAVSTNRTSGMRILQVAALVACADIGNGVLHDATREEFFGPQGIRSFLKGELGSDAQGILAALNT